MKLSNVVFVALVLCSLLAPPALVAQLANDIPEDPRDPLHNMGSKTEAVGDKVMVSTQLPIVTETALQVLRDGGNAIDAFITAVFLQNVVDYHQVSLFGAMGGLYYEAATGKYHVFESYSERPLAGRCGEGDASKVAIGGKARGLEALAKRFGTREWATYLEPAITAAEEGVLVTSFMYGNNYNSWENRDLIQKNERARDFYMPEGHLVGVGHRWKMPALAQTLRKIATEGADYLYTGDWGQKFVEECRKKGYCVCLEDMGGFEVRWSEPVRSTYRGYEILSEPPPKKGGIQIAYNLNILENFDLKSLGHFMESADTLEIMARAFGRVEYDMRMGIADPVAFKIPSSVWLSKDYAKFGAELVKNTTVLPGVDLTPPEKVTESRRESEKDRLARIIGPLEILDESNHNVIVDAEGNWISSLHTGHGGAPGIFIDGIRATGSGFPGQTAGPGRRVSPNSTGTIVAKDGKPWLSLGSPGVPPQPVSQVLVNIIDFGMHPKDAAAAVRFFAYRTNDRVLAIESRISEKVRKEMKARGIKVEELGPYNWHTGSMQIIWRDPETGKLHGVSDPRRLGHAAGF
jgi:gamma-glutamyltranspeptidase/glutathione hydrolase